MGDVHCLLSSSLRWPQLFPWLLLQAAPSSLWMIGVRAFPIRQVFGQTALPMGAGVLWVVAKLEWDAACLEMRWRKQAFKREVATLASLTASMPAPTATCDGGLPSHCGNDSLTVGHAPWIIALDLCQCFHRLLSGKQAPFLLLLAATAISSQRQRQQWLLMVRMPPIMAASLFLWNESL